MLRPLASSYRLGNFQYVPPAGDGWRQLESGERFVRLVYAEDLQDGQINTRVEFAAESYDIPDPSLVTNGVALTFTSMEQRRKEREAALVAFSNVAPVAGTDGLYSYSLVSKMLGEDYVEVFYVMLAPDKSSYFAGKLATKDVKYDEAPYWAAFAASLGSIAYLGGEKPGADQPDQPPAVDSDDSAGSPDTPGAD